MGKRAVILCAGLHGKVVAETVRLLGTHEVVGFLDDKLWGNAKFVGLPVLGPLALLDVLVDRGDVDAAAMGLGNIRLLGFRRSLYESALKTGVDFIPAVHPTAFVSPSAQCGDGIFLAPHTAVHVDSRLGDNVCIYTGSTIDHDNTVGDHVFIGPGVHTAGQVTIGAGAYIGPGCSIASGCTIGADAIIGAGSVVVQDIPNGVIAFGVPARVRETVSAWKARKA